MDATEPCDIFISYSAQSGSKPAKHLDNAFSRKGLRAYVYEHSLVPGYRWEEPVLRQLRYCRCVLVLVPPGKKKGLTDYQNHEIGIAHAMGKVIIPIALGSDFSSSAQMSALASPYWGWPLEKFKRKLNSFISEQGIDSAAKLTTVWSRYLVSDSARIVVGGIDPAKLGKKLPDLAGDYYSIGVFRSITRLAHFFSQQFGADFLDELLIAQKTGNEEIKRHDLIVIGGPNSLHASPLENYHKRLGIQYEGKTYCVGPQNHRVSSDDLDEFRREACVLAFAPNPMSLHKELLLVSGDSGYGCQGAIEYLVDIRSDLELVAAAVTQWRKGPRNAPLFFEVFTEFESQSNTYRVGSGMARLIDCTG